MGGLIMDIISDVNPVVLVFGFFLTLFSGVGIWSFLSTLLTRRSDTHAKDMSALKDLEKASSDFRNEVRLDKAELKSELREMKEAFISLIDLLDELLPKMIETLTMDERIALRAKINVARMKT